MYGSATSWDFIYIEQSGAYDVLRAEHSGVCFVESLAEGLSELGSYRRCGGNHKPSVNSVIDLEIGKCQWLRGISSCQLAFGLEGGGWNGGVECR
jgi:hypothetical protein